MSTYDFLSIVEIFVNSKALLALQLNQRELTQ